jgi:2-polyprenyl-6-methoxyphenol hydroxylase-like FAD-dependent oxidoreductase
MLADILALGVQALQFVNKLGGIHKAEILKRLHAQGKDIGQHLYLRRYERSRKHSAALMLAGMSRKPCMPASISAALCLRLRS